MIKRTIFLARLIGISFIFLFSILSISYAIEINLENTAQKAEARYYIGADGTLRDDSVFLPYNPASAVLTDSISNNGASASLDISSSVSCSVTKNGAGAKAGIFLNAEGKLFSSSESSYDAGAYAGLQTTLITAPSANAYDSFWGKEVDGLPVRGEWQYYDSLNIDTSNNFRAQAYYTDYQYGKEEFEGIYGSKFNGAGENSLIMPYKSSTINRTSLASISSTEAHYNNYSEEAPQNQVFLTQLGDKISLFVETDYRMTTLDTALSSEANFNTEVSHSLDVNYIDSKDVTLKLISDVPEIIQDPNNGLLCRHAGAAMVARYWEDRYLKAGVIGDVSYPSDKPIVEQNKWIMEQMLIYEKDIISSQGDEYGATVLNRYFNDYVNNKISEPAKKLSAISYNYTDLKVEQLKSELEQQHPIFFRGPTSSGIGHVSVAYGSLELEDPIGPAPWIAIHDTWDPYADRKASSKNGQKLWTQEGGYITAKEYDNRVQWFPTPNIWATDGTELLKDSRFGYWQWTDFKLTGPMGERQDIVGNQFNDLNNWDEIFPIFNPLGDIDIISAPTQFNIEGGMLRLFTPDGSPVGFSLDVIFPEDFEIRFKYAGLGDGMLQLLLDGNPFREIGFSSQDLNELLLFDEIFQASDLGIDPYRLHNLSFILKSAGDPELYFDDLSIRNLNFGNPAVGVPEPTSLSLVTLGLTGLMFKRRRSYRTIEESKI